MKKLKKAPNTPDIADSPLRITIVHRTSDNSVKHFVIKVVRSDIKFVWSWHKVGLFPNHNWY